MAEIEPVAEEKKAVKGKKDKVVKEKKAKAQEVRFRFFGEGVGLMLAWCSRRRRRLASQCKAWRADLDVGALEDELATFFCNAVSHCSSAKEPRLPLIATLRAAQSSCCATTARTRA